MTTLDDENSKLDRLSSGVASDNNSPVIIRCNGIDDDVIVDVPPNANASQTNRVGFRLLRGYRKEKTKQRHRNAYDRDVIIGALDEAAAKRLPIDGTKPDDDDEDKEDEEKKEVAALPNAMSELKSSCTIVVEPDVAVVVVDRKRLCLNCCKRCAAFLLSTVGLSVLTVAYTIMGGVIFSAVESPNERHVQSGVKDSLRWHVTYLWEVTSDFNVLHPTNWSNVAEELFLNYTREVFMATKNKGWDGSMESGEELGDGELQWSFAGSLLFSVTVITTIGYGNIAPKTALGRFVTIPYAIVGIPLTLLTIAHLGGFMATVFRFLYKNVIYRICCPTFISCRKSKNQKSINELCYVIDQPPLDDVAPLDDVIAVAPATAATLQQAIMGSRLFLDPENIEAEQRILEYSGDDGGGTAVLSTMSVSGGRRGMAALGRMRESYRGIIEWRRGITNALYTADNQQVRVPLYVSLLLIAGYVSLGAMMFGLWERDWDFLIGSYFCFVTLSTIGFGDFVPGTSLDDWSSQQKLVLCSLYLVFGLALLAMCFDLMQEEARKKCRRCGEWLGLIEKHRTTVIAVVN